MGYKPTRRNKTMNIFRVILHTIRSSKYQPTIAHVDFHFEKFENVASLLQEWVTLGVINLQVSYKNSNVKGLATTSIKKPQR